MLIILLLLSACGQQNAASVDISNTKIIWEGTPDKYPGLLFPFPDTMLQQFDETMTCLNSLGVFHAGYPYVIMVQTSFPCGDLPDALGCTDLNRGIIYTVKDVGSGWFRHEVVHWGTRLGNSHHQDIYFTQCQGNLVGYSGY